VDETGALTYRQGPDNVEQSLQILLLTRLGERVMRPGFGTRSASLIFAPGIIQNLRLLEDSVREAVVRWEPRVDLDDVRAEANPGEETHVTVSIDYRVRGTNTRQNLVFPFYTGTLEVDG